MARGGSLTGFVGVGDDGSRGLSPHLNGGHRLEADNEAFEGMGACSDFKFSLLCQLFQRRSDFGNQGSVDVQATVSGQEFAKMRNRANSLNGIQERLRVRMLESC